MRVESEIPVSVHLANYDNSWYSPGSSKLKQFLWYFTNVVFFINPLFPFSGVKSIILKFFGAKVGRGVVIKPGVNIKYPWFLKIGDYSWIGEKVWIDNLGIVEIGSNVILSQGSMLLTGSHDYKRPGFDLIVKGITLEDGVWIGAFSIVCPGVVCGTHCVLSVNSVASRDLAPYAVYQGNPAEFRRQRIIQ